MPIAHDRRNKPKDPKYVAQTRIELLESRRLLTAAVWTGAVNSLFTDAGNWQGGVAPTSGQDVDFPAGAVSTAVTIDSNVIVGNVEFDASYTLSSSSNASRSLTIDGGLEVTAGVPIINNRVILGANSIWLINDSAGLQTNGTISDAGDGFGIDKQGNGAFGIAGSGGAYTGITSDDGGVLIDTAPLASPVSASTGNSFYGSSSVGSIVDSNGTITPATFDASGDTSAPATLTVNDGIDLSGESGATLAFDLDGPSNSSNFVVSAGTINLNNANFSTTVVDGYTPAPGDVITLIHNNTGTAITGTFLNLPQGATTTIGGTNYTISYTGGSDGRDVTLTAPGTAANPDIVSHTTLTSTHGFSVAAAVVATDTSTGGTAGLTYTWTAVHLPSGAKTPTYNVNGTNSAKNITARFYKDGTYILQCLVKDKSGSTATADVTVVVSQKATSIKLEPHGASIAKRKTKQFTATVLDQFGHALRTVPTIAYSVPSGGGTISDTGLFLAGATAEKIEIEAKDGTLAAIVDAKIT